MSVYDIEQRIKQIKLQYNYNLDYLVIDYDDLIKLTGEKEKQYLDLGQLYRDLKSLAQRYNIGVLIASQLNRDAMTNKSSGLRNTSGSIQKVQIADIVIHLEDREAEGLLLRITKSRRGIKNRDVNVVPDFEHGDLLGIPIGSLNSYTMPSFEGLNVKDF
jgi:KaiC/GvpD/RAD55 family RecA-like ATPase